MELVHRTIWYKNESGERIHPRNLKFVREYRGYSQVKLSKSIDGLSQPNLSMFENGYCHYLSEDLLRRIMVFLNWPYNFLFYQLSRADHIDFNLSK